MTHTIPQIQKHREYHEFKNLMEQDGIEERAWTLELVLILLPCLLFFRSKFNDQLLAMSRDIGHIRSTENITLALMNSQELA